MLATLLQARTGGGAGEDLLSPEGAGHLSCGATAVTDLLEGGGAGLALPQVTRSLAPVSATAELAATRGLAQQRLATLLAFGLSATRALAEVHISI